MSSRLIPLETTVEAAPIVWRQAGGVPVQTMRLRSVRAQEAEGDVEREIEARVQAAFQQGQTAGEAATAQRAAQRMEPVLASLKAIIEELSAVRKKFRKEAEEDTVKLAIAIGRRVLHRELATDPEAILGLVLAAFQKLNARETQRLRVSPADARTLEDNRARLEFPPGMEIAADPSLARGSAVFETTRGELDASVDTQLSEIGRGLADVMRRRPT
jgi:flagellar assembly protein FliH